MRNFERRKIAMVVAALLAPIAHAQSGESFQAVPAQIPVSAPPSRLAASTNEKVQVVVVLGGDAVAAVQSRLGRALSEAERRGIVALRASEQTLVRSLLEARGARVLGAMQSALNGIQVEIARNRLGELRRLPGVVDVLPVGEYFPNNAVSVPLIGAPAVWQGLAAAKGQNVKVAIIDTGIDYTHANFGGPGTVAAFQAAQAAGTSPADPAWFGPGAPKVKGGTDLVGDAYTGSNTPQPDPNPLDCNGHGSHVAGSAAGFGVRSNGTTFTGPYNNAAYTPGAFRIGPGVAPLADLYAIRVFGCTGSTRVTAQGIDWAVANGMDVINMSLGSSYGSVQAGTAEAAAVANARAAGVLVVASSGNAGPTPYITGTPGTTPGALSVAATDALASLPMGNMALSTGPTLSVINANGAIYQSPLPLQVVVLRNPNGSVSLGCNPDEYDKTKNGGIDITGKLVVTMRGTCARVFRAGATQHFGGAAAAMINTDSGLPPYEGPIPGGAASPADGNIFEPVTIPFFGIAGADGGNFATAATSPASATVTNAGAQANAGFLKIASFSSSGPRIGDSVMRPGVTAPGVATVSTGVGTGNDARVLSGTSMAAPHVAGVAALVRQVNPGWSVDDQRSAIVQTASPTLMSDYSVRFEGSGLVQPVGATGTQAVVRTPDDSVSFGYADLLADFSGMRQLTVRNFSPKAVQFNIAVTKKAGPAGVTTMTPATIAVPANGEASFPFTLNVPAAQVPATGFQEVGGYIQLTPSNSRLNNNVKLTVPYYLVANARSNVLAGDTVPTNPGVSGTVALSNPGGIVAGTPVFYAVGQIQPTPQGILGADVRSIGATLSGTTVIFGVHTHSRNSTSLGYVEYDVCIDTSGGPGFTPNKVLIGINGSLLSTNAAVQNQFTTALFPADANCNVTGGGTLLFTVANPTDSSTVQLPVPRGGTTPTNGLGLTAANPRFKYQLRYYPRDGAGAAMPGTGSFNAFTPGVTVTGGGSIAPNTAGAATINVNAENANTPALGVLVSVPTNASGLPQGKVVALP